LARPKGKVQGRGPLPYPATQQGQPCRRWLKALTSTESVTQTGKGKGVGLWGNSGVETFCQTDDIYKFLDDSKNLGFWPIFGTFVRGYIAIFCKNT